jgi:hypothetical protein
MTGDAPLPPKLPETANDVVHRHSISNAIGFVILGIFLLALSGSMLVLGILSLWSVLALVMSIVAIGGGFKALATRKRYPMILSEDRLMFYRKGEQVRVPISEITRVWYNTHGIDKRVSVGLKGGSVVDIPTAYGLDPLRKKIQKRYALANGR